MLSLLRNSVVGALRTRAPLSGAAPTSGAIGALRTHVLIPRACAWPPLTRAFLPCFSHSLHLRLLCSSTSVQPPSSSEGSGQDIPVSAPEPSPEREAPAVVGRGPGGSLSQRQRGRPPAAARQRKRRLLNKQRRRLKNLNRHRTPTKRGKKGKKDFSVEAKMIKLKKKWGM